MDLMAPLSDAAARTARRLCRSADEGDDLMQETILRAFEKLPSLRDETCFRAWFYAVLLSIHRSRSRRAFWKRFLAFGEGPDAMNGPVGEDGLAREEERMRAERASRALATLPAAQREAVVLFDVDGMSLEEVAAAQRVSVSAVKSRLARGRARLRRHYERLGFGSGETRVRRGDEPCGLAAGVIPAPLPETVRSMAMTMPPVGGLSRKGARDEG